MKRLLIKFFLGWAVNILAIYVASMYLEKFNYDSWQVLVLVALGFGTISMFARPILKILSLPFFLIGPILFFVANSIILFFLGIYIKGFHTGDIRTVVYAGVIEAVVNFLVHLIIK